MVAKTAPVKPLRSVHADHLPALLMVDLPNGANIPIVLNHVDRVPKLDLDHAQTHHPPTEASLVMEMQLKLQLVTMDHARSMVDSQNGANTLLVPNLVVLEPKPELDRAPHQHQLMVARTALDQHLIPCCATHTNAQPDVMAQ